MSKIDEGIVRLSLGGEEVELLPTLKAIKRISAAFGGITNALAKIQALDFEAYVTVIKHGALADDALAKRLDELVFATRPVRLMPDLVRYLMILANGGRPLSDDDAASAEAEGNGQAATAA